MKPTYTYLVIHIHNYVGSHHLIGFVWGRSGGTHFNQWRYSISHDRVGWQFQIQDQPHIKLTILFYLFSSCDTKSINNKNRHTQYFIYASWLFLTESTYNKLMFKSKVFHNASAEYINDRSNNEFAQTLLTGGTRNTQKSKDARVRTVTLLSVNTSGTGWTNTTEMSLLY